LFWIATSPQLRLLAMTPARFYFFTPGSSPVAAISFFWRGRVDQVGTD
jgi:hypothetical protein